MGTIASFDEQSADFDRRAGIPTPHTAAVAAAVVEITQLHDGGRLLEIGAGTGQIGAHFIEHGIDYLALDRSRPMLEVFAQRIRAEDRERLLVGDADRRWPIADCTLRVVFLSRVAHLLDPAMLWSETQRCAGPTGCWLLLGRRGRDPASVRVRLRQRMHQLLADEGIEHRRGDRPEQAFDALEAQGGTSRIRTEVARWSVTHRPLDALQAWHSKTGLAGVELDRVVKARILERLEKSAREFYGDLEAAYPSEEYYELHGLLAPGR